MFDKYEASPWGVRAKFNVDNPGSPTLVRSTKATDVFIGYNVSRVRIVFGIPILMEGKFDVPKNIKSLSSEEVDEWALNLFFSHTTMAQKFEFIKLVKQNSEKDGQEQFRSKICDLLRNAYIE